MTVPPPALLPDGGERGLITADLRGTLRATLHAWDSLIDVAESVDMSAPTRKDGRTAARVLVVVGTWPESRSCEQMRSDALAGRRTAEPLDIVEARVLDARLSSSRDEILDALRRARDAIEEWSTSPDVSDEALLPVGGPLGVVPLGTLVCASAFQCAVAALDLEPAGPRAPQNLVEDGLRALVDVVGAVGAGQHAEIALIVGSADDGPAPIGTGAAHGDWRTTELDGASAAQGPALIGSARTLVDVAAGRASVLSAYARGDLRVRDVDGLLDVARALAAAPGLPGTEGLRSALAAYGAARGLAGGASDAARSAAASLRGWWSRGSGP